MSDEEKINYTKIAVLSIGQPNSVFVCDDQGFVASAFLEKERPATEADVQEHPFFEVGETMYFVRFLHDLADDMLTVEALDEPGHGSELHLRDISQLCVPLTV